MSGMQKYFDTAKLQLHRLNEDWSLIGSTFSHEAARHLRTDWIETNPSASVTALMTAQTHMLAAYAKHCDPESGYVNPVVQAHDLRRWNEMYDAAANTLLVLEDCLHDKDRKRYEQNKTNLYKQLF